MKKMIIILMLSLTLNGCAYLVNGDNQVIDLKTSDSKKVKVKVKNDKVQSTYTIPSKIDIKKSQNDLIITTIGTECIVPTQTIVKSSTDAWVWGNIATLGFGLIKDTDGAMWKYDNSYIVNVNRDNACIKKAKELNSEMLNLHR